MPLVAAGGPGLHVSALPYEDGAFDGVFSMFALTLMAHRTAAFCESHRVLRAGGRAVVGTPTSLTRLSSGERSLPRVSLRSFNDPSVA